MKTVVCFLVLLLVTPFCGAPAQIQAQGNQNGGCPTDTLVEQDGSNFWVGNSRVPQEELPQFEDLILTNDGHIGLVINNHYVEYILRPGAFHATHANDNRIGQWDYEVPQSLHNFELQAVQPLDNGNFIVLTHGEVQLVWPDGRTQVLLPAQQPEIIDVAGVIIRTPGGVQPLEASDQIYMVTMDSDGTFHSYRFSTMGTLIREVSQRPGNTQLAHVRPLGGYVGAVDGEAPTATTAQYSLRYNAWGNSYQQMPLYLARYSSYVEFYWIDWTQNAAIIDGGFITQQDALIALVRTGQWTGACS